MRGVRKPVVAIDYKGDIIGAYDSILQAARINESNPDNIYKAIQKKTFHRKVRWMYEEEYRDYWMSGRTDELRNSYKQWKQEVAMKRRDAMTEETRKSRAQKVSAARKAYLKEHPESMVKRTRRVLCVTTGEKFDSVTDFARRYGMHISNVSHAIRSGHRAKGMVVKYL